MCDLGWVLTDTLDTAVTGSRVMSGRVPLPTPAWKQSADLDNIIPSDMDQATGLERAEMLASLAGKKLFEEKAVSTRMYPRTAPYTNARARPGATCT